MNTPVNVVVPSTRAAKPGSLALEIGRMIEMARKEVAHTTNVALTTLYWRIGTRVRQDILKEQRAEYGATVVAALGRQLEEQFGRGFGEKKTCAGWSNSRKHFPTPGLSYR